MGVCVSFNIMFGVFNHECMKLFLLFLFVPVHPKSWCRALKSPVIIEYLSAWCKMSVLRTVRCLELCGGHNMM